MKKALPILAIIVVIIVIILSFFNNYDKKIVDNLKLNKFTEIEKNNYYKKVLSEKTLKEYNSSIKAKKEASYEQLTFSLENYKAEKLYSYYEDEVEAVYNSEYDFIKEEIVYKVRFTYSSLNVIIIGTYKDEKINSCNIDFSYDAKKEILKDELCNKAKEYNKTFISQISSIFNKEDKDVIIKAAKNLK